MRCETAKQQPPPSISPPRGTLTEVTSLITMTCVTGKTPALAHSTAGIAPWYPDTRLSQNRRRRPRPERRSRDAREDRSVDRGVSEPRPPWWEKRPARGVHP